MKVYISADIEGVTGAAHFDEINKEKPDYKVFSEQMTKEVNAACQGANNAGAREIWIMDAHSTGRNIDAMALPENTKVIRGSSGHPFIMMQELDKSFDAVMLVGYHAYATSELNPLSHTITHRLAAVRINDELASEFLINTYTAEYLGVPVVFISGDDGVCRQAVSLNENIKTVAVKKGIGASVISMHPKLALTKIRDAAESALKGEANRCRVKLPSSFSVAISYKDHHKAYKASFYPGMKMVSSTTVLYETDDYFEVLRAMSFVFFV
jgi:D-amino peptidase